MIGPQPHTVITQSVASCTNFQDSALQDTLTIFYRQLGALTSKQVVLHGIRTSHEIHTSGSSLGMKQLHMIHHCQIMKCLPQIYSIYMTPLVSGWIFFAFLMFLKVPGTPICSVDIKRSLADHPPWDTGCKPVNLVAVNGCKWIIETPTGVEQVESVVLKLAVEAEAEFIGARALRCRSVGRAEAHGPRLAWNNVHLLPTGWARMDGLESDGVDAILGTGNNQWLGVALVLDLTNVGRGVGVEETEGLEIGYVKAATTDGEVVGVGASSVVCF